MCKTVDTWWTYVTLDLVDGRVIERVDRVVGCCRLCGKRLVTTGRKTREESQEAAQRNLERHVDQRCPVTKLLREWEKIKPGITMGEIAEFYTGAEDAALDTQKGPPA